MTHMPTAWEARAQDIYVRKVPYLNMGYQAAARLREFAELTGVIGEYRVQRLIHAVTMEDDPELESDAEEYITHRAAEKLFKPEYVKR